MSAAEIKFDRPLSLDNTGQHADRGARQSTAFYKTTGPQAMHFAHYKGVSADGDNATFMGAGVEYVIASDKAGITAAQRGCLYGIALSVVPAFDRTNTPFDDVACLVLSNDGVGRATELLYVGKGAHTLDPCAIAAIGIEANFVSAIWFIGHADYAIDCSRALATPASLNKAFARIPPNTVAIQARNVANTADINLLGSLADVPTLADKRVRAPVAYTPTVAPATGALTADSYGMPEYSAWSQINGRVIVDACVHIGTVGTAAGDLLIGLPKPALARGALYGHDTASGWGVYGEILPGESVARCRFINSATPITASNFIFVSGSYRPAND